MPTGMQKITRSGMPSSKPRGRSTKKRFFDLEALLRLYDIVVCIPFALLV